MDEGRGGKFGGEAIDRTGEVGTGRLSPRIPHAHHMHARTHLP